MNRAWIPAGALAGVSVAGLLALGPLTDSMGTGVPFPQAITGPSQGTGKPGTSQQLAPVSLDISVRTPVGKTTTKGPARGSQATAPGDPNASQGFVSVEIHKPQPKSNTAPGTARIVTAKPKPKKTVTSTRKSISTAGETNDTSGLAGENSPQTGHGEQSQTPSGDGN